MRPHLHAAVLPVSTQWRWKAEVDIWPGRLEGLSLLWKAHVPLLAQRPQVFQRAAPGPWNVPSPEKRLWPSLSQPGRSPQFQFCRPALSFAWRALTTLLSPPLTCWRIVLVPPLSHIPVWALLPSLPHPCSEPPLALAL